MNITGLEEKEIEVPAIRKILDDALRRQGHADCHTVANTISPALLWKRSSSRQTLYDRYLKMLPKIRRRDAGNQYILFERMIRFGKTGTHINQLEHLFGIWETVRSVPRPISSISSIRHGIIRGSRSGDSRACSTSLSRPRYGEDVGRCDVSGAVPLRAGLRELPGTVPAREVRRGKKPELNLTQLTCVVGIGLPGDISKRRVLRELARALKPHMIEAGEREATPITTEKSDG